MADSDSKAGFKVVDKRLFAEGGQERSETAAQSAAAEQGFVLKESEKESQSDTKAGAEDARPIDFASFIMSLATQALMQLGEVPPPEGVRVPVDKGAAKQTIEILSLLQEKTKGNLEEMEANLLEEILHSVRLAFVKKA